MQIVFTDNGPNIPSLWRAIVHVSRWHKAQVWRGTGVCTCFSAISFYCILCSPSNGDCFLLFASCL